LKIGAILPHVLVFGGVRRYIELGNAFTLRGDEFIIYSPEGDRPSWCEYRGDCRPMWALGDDRLDVLITGSPEYFDTLAGARASIRIFYLQLMNVDREREIAGSDRIMLMANSGGLARDFRKRYGIEVLDGRGGINARTFHPMGKGRPLGDGKVRLICYGRLSRPRKGTRFVVRAAEKLLRSGLETELHLFDSRVSDEDDPRTGFDATVPFRFYYDLPQERMAAMYGAADIFVSAEHRAGWSNTCAEAAACGLPIICTESGTADFAENGKSAVVISRRSPAAIIRAVEKLYCNGEEARRLGEEARKRILEFTWDKVCDRMAGTFERLLGKGVISTGREDF
jgi:glycosyltransferase involved in cell wall biosynthesis